MAAHHTQDNGSQLLIFIISVAVLLALCVSFIALYGVGIAPTSSSSTTTIVGSSSGPYVKDFISVLGGTTTFRKGSALLHGAASGTAYIYFGKNESKGITSKLYLNLRILNYTDTDLMNAFYHNISVTVNSTATPFPSGNVTSFAVSINLSSDLTANLVGGRVIEKGTLYSFSSLYKNRIITASVSIENISLSEQSTMEVLLNAMKGSQTCIDANC
jgi:hypothetical protein